MSEFDQHFRVFGVAENEILSLLGQLDSWEVGEAKTPNGELVPTLTRAGATGGLSDMLSITHDAKNNYTTLRLWNLDAHEDIVAALNGRELAYLSHVFHTGAGFDELQVYADGKLRLSEDLGELYEFSIDDERAELDYDWDREDDRGRRFLKPEPLRATALERLTEEMGESAAILHGWTQCIEEELPLYYLPGLD